MNLPPTLVGKSKGAEKNGASFFVSHAVACVVFC